MEENKVEFTVDLGVETLLRILEDRNVDPDSIYVINMEESFKDNDTVEVSERFQMVKIKNIQEDK
ncbi:hypothetical protein [Bacillus phage vB_BceM_Bc431v3]|uniref:Uncharacterized protein n=1 Tax=Bacillus phage vB_BceM_Bc431v3 TaxID=1195072 RepID=M4HPB4_9CAUD|nr:hypothetical protein K201_gp124 [Bacillus phage vB_BceM_Bc431v3]AFQ96432.1 hypothetical protein [Bacillus phage vB_BceM_Bc431v3]